MPYKDADKRRAFQNRHYNIRAQRIRDIKEQNPCMDCGKFFPYYVMDFDHREDKLRTLNHMRTYSVDKIEAEIAKCDLVCSNCHRIRTFLRLRGVMD